MKYVELWYTVCMYLYMLNQFIGMQIIFIIEILSLINVNEFFPESYMCSLCSVWNNIWNI